MSGVLRDAVWAALDTVLDPELDEPITSLEFVQSCTVSDDPEGSGTVATVRLRLPTFFCSPNFSWLMVADAYDAITSARAYRGARPPADALRELWRCAGTEFHADIVAALASALPGVTSDVTYGVLEQV